MGEEGKGGEVRWDEDGHDSEMKNCLVVFSTVVSQPKTTRVIYFTSTKTDTLRGESFVVIVRGEATVC